MKKVIAVLLIVKNYSLDTLETLHENLVIFIIRRTIGLNERAARVFETNNSSNSVAGSIAEIGSIAAAQISGSSDIPDMPIFPELSVEFERYQPICDFEDNQNQL